MKNAAPISANAPNTMPGMRELVTISCRWGGANSLVALQRLPLPRRLHTMQAAPAPTPPAGPHLVVVPRQGLEVKRICSGEVRNCDAAAAGGEGRHDDAHGGQDAR